MSTFLERLQTEQQELQVKLVGLFNFINSDSYNQVSEGNQELLNMQYKHMVDYNRILLIRLEILKK